MNRNLAIAALIFINILWGSTYAVTKVALEEIPPTLLGVMRFTLGTLCLWLIQLWWSRRRGRKWIAEEIARRDQMRLMGLGVLGVGFSYIFSYTGIRLTTATEASLMIIGEVTFTSLLASWVLKDTLGKWKILGILTGAVGVVMLVLGHISGAEGDTNGLARAIGDLLILCALLCQAAYTVFGTGLARRYQPLTVLTFAYTGSLLVWMPLLAWHILAGTLPATLSYTAIAGVIYLTLIASIFCYLIWFSISRQIGAGLSALSLFAQPLVGSLIGLFFLGEPLTGRLLVGGGLIFVALYLTTIQE